MARAKTPAPSSLSTPKAPGADTEAAPTPQVKAKSPATPSFEAIAQRAYEIFQARGGEHGRHEEDWEQAERELKLGRQ